MAASECKSSTALLPTSGKPSATPVLTTELAIWLIMVFMGLQPIGTDLYLPSLPGLAEDFQVPQAHAQWTLSAYVAGFGAAQLLLGPLADRYGRRPLLMGSALLYLLAAIACAAAPSLPLLVAARFVQAIGTCGAIIGARAMVRDLFDPTQGARVFAAASSRMAVLPLFSPVLGGYLEGHFGWRANFVAIALYSLIVVAVGLMWLRETLPADHRQSLQLRPLLAGYREIMRSRVFRAYTLAASATFATLMTYLAGSAVVYIKVFGQTPQQFGIWLSATVLGYIIGATTCRHLLPRIGIVGTLKLAGVCAASFGLIELALAHSGWHHPLALMLPNVGLVFCHGLVQPTAQTGAIAPFPQRAGAAAALLGMVMMLIASFVSWLVGASFDGTSIPLATISCVNALILAVSTLILVPRVGAPSQPETPQVQP